MKRYNEAKQKQNLDGNQHLDLKTAHTHNVCSRADGTELRQSPVDLWSSQQSCEPDCKLLTSGHMRARMILWFSIACIQVVKWTAR